MNCSIKTILLTIALILFSLSAFSQEDARQIYEQATSQLLTGNMEMEMELDIKDKKGRVKEKGYDILIGTFGEVEKTKMSWQKPEAAKGTTVVFTTLPDETGLIEVYTPSNGKIRKLKATPENMELVGSEAQITSFTTQDTDELRFTNLPAQELEGKSCYSIEVKDKNSADEARGELLIEKETYRIVQITVFDKDGKKTSFISLSEFQPVEGFETKVHPMRIVTEDFENQKQTDMRVTKVASRTDLTEKDFLLPVALQEM